MNEGETDLGIFVEVFIAEWFVVCGAIGGIPFVSGFVGFAVPDDVDKVEPVQERAGEFN